MDDENVSALQQITRGGGGLTLASQWKSQFDDSEETDNEWKQGEQLQSPEHRIVSISQAHTNNNEAEAGVNDSGEKGTKDAERAREKDGGEVPSPKKVCNMTYSIIFPNPTQFPPGILKIAAAGNLFN